VRRKFFGEKQFCLTFKLKQIVTQNTSEVVKVIERKHVFVNYMNKKLSHVKWDRAKASIHISSKI
jgi:hypothetical protein